MATVNHEEILAANGLEGLSSALDCDDQETVFNACYALNKLAMNDANHEVGRLSKRGGKVASTLVYPRERPLVEAGGIPAR